MKTAKDPSAKTQQVDELLVKLKTHKQEAIDCLIASRAAYEPTLDGVADVLERSYEVDTSRYELLYHHEQPTFLSARFVDNQEQVYIIVRSSNGCVMVAFRGTFTLQDAIQDLKLTTAPVSFGVGRAHVGFRSRAEKMPIKLFMELARPGEKLVFTGHSLGGAVASLTTLMVLEELEAAGDSGKYPITRDQVLCVTFGTAPFANKALAMHINSKYRDRFYHLVSMHDFVPRAHNMFPKLFFPLAQRYSKRIRESARFQEARNYLQRSPTGVALNKYLKQLEALF